MLAVEERLLQWRTVRAGVLSSQVEADLAQTGTVRILGGLHLEIIVELLQPIAVADLGGRLGEPEERRQLVDGRQSGLMVERGALEAGR